VKHKPLPPSKRGKLLGAYAVAIIGCTACRRKVIVLYREEIDEVRKNHSKQWWERTRNNQKEIIPLEELTWYGPKTCVKRICKLLPTNPRMEKVLTTIEARRSSDADFEIDRLAAPRASGTSSVRTRRSQQRPIGPAEAGDDDLKF
jgi:hypothetical protein